jgi:hypothetical protein
MAQHGLAERMYNSGESIADDPFEVDTSRTLLFVFGAT